MWQVASATRLQHVCACTREMTMHGGAKAGRRTLAEHAQSMTATGDALDEEVLVYLLSVLHRQAACEVDLALPLDRDACVRGLHALKRSRCWRC